ncbi:carboxypeptidase-like regulatory domain-containing protein [Pedobacter fastidiosus]|uniref:Carboxypeptidase-like regulatory domain-containing protein n=1 Tax=Pedobacter fastidiosus TaxID=2765361 RepID=A0ABR7KP62_9SPHI|nr:carboxypeptidase-like regulatory domain-containing protein [Pedobacter fastidiosus]MBC6109886.1 carboxypeptidase-like regulatory domain-containing protein [Pedobacter fastidiosus]
MATPFKISINNPCNQQWDNMQKNQDGRFCNSCQKSVIDFTEFSDEDLRNWFTKANENVCGKLNANQLDRLIITETKFSIHRFRPSLIAASLFAFLSFPKLSNANIKIIYPTFQSDKRSNQIDLIESDTLIDSIVTIKGRVIDKDNKQPIFLLSVVIKGAKKSVVTDNNGNFEIKLNKNKFPDKVTLDFRYIGYESKEIKVNLKNQNELFIEMKVSEAMLGGLGINREKSTFEKIRAIFNA